MSSPTDSPANSALQILFGIAGIFSVIVALFGLHYRESVGFVLYRRLTSGRSELHELEEGLARADANAGNQRLSPLLSSTPPLPRFDSQSIDSSSSETLSSCLSRILEDSFTVVQISLPPSGPEPHLARSDTQSTAVSLSETSSPEPPTPDGIHIILYHSLQLKLALETAKILSSSLRLMLPRVEEQRRPSIDTYVKD